MPVKNRLEELQRASKHVKEPSSKKPVEQEMSPLQTSDMSGSCAEFFQNFQSVIEDIDRVEENVSAVRKLHGRILYEPVKSPSSESALNDLVEENRRLGKRIRQRLSREQELLGEKDVRKMEGEIKGAKAAKESSRKLHELRMRRNQVAAQSRRFYDVWTGYSLEQGEYRDRSKELLVRRVRIANSGDLTDEDIEEMIDKGDSNVFAASILEQTSLAKKQLSELQDRHGEFIRLEMSIKEVHDLYLELGVLVSQQGEAIDSIFHNVEKASCDVEKGKKELGNAERHQKSARRKKIICGSLLLVVLAIVIIVLLSEFGAFGGT